MRRVRGPEALRSACAPARSLAPRFAAPARSPAPPVCCACPKPCAPVCGGSALRFVSGRSGASAAARFARLRLAAPRAPSPPHAPRLAVASARRFAGRPRFAITLPAWWTVCLAATVAARGASAAWLAKPPAALVALAVPAAHRLPRRLPLRLRPRRSPARQLRCRWPRRPILRPR